MRKNTKKAVALIELIFSIVIIGLCLSVIPKVAQATTENTKFSFKQEYINELKGVYGILRKMPFDKINYCKSDFDENSFLAQFCARNNPDDKTHLFDSYYRNLDLDRLGLDDRFGVYTPNVVTAIFDDIEDKVNLSDFNYIDVLNRHNTYKVREDLGFKNIANPTENLEIKLTSARKESTVSDVYFYSLKIISTDINEDILNFTVPMTYLGRLDSIYPRHDLPN